MKTLSFLCSGFFLIISAIGCSDGDQHYIDLATGKHIKVVKDSTTGEMVNAETKEPVVIYVDTHSNDTIYGKTGKVINNHVTKTDDGYKYVSNEDQPEKVKTDDDGSYKIKDEDYKKKVEKDGDVKIKDGDDKLKVEGKTGDKKVKND